MRAVKNYAELANKVEKTIRNPKRNKIIILLVSTIFFFLLFSLVNAGLPSIGPIHIAVFALLFLLYYGVKGIAFQHTALALSQKISYKRSLKAFFVSDFVELITFSGKLGGDATKYFLFRKRIEKRQLIFLIVLFRVLSIASLAAAVGLFLLWETGIATWIGIIGAVLLVTLFWFKHSAKRKKNYADLVVAFFSNLFCQFISVLTMVFVATLFGLEITPFLIVVFMASKTIGILTLLPFGIGTQDLSFSAYLGQFLTVGEIVSFNVLLRVVTVVPSTIIGWFIVSRAISKSK